MKHRLLILLFIVACTQSKQIFSSHKKKLTTLHTQEDFKKILKISTLLEDQLTLFQAHHAYELNLNREQALIAAQKNLLKTAKSCLNKSVMRNDTALAAYFDQKEKKYTADYLAMGSLIKDVAQTIIAAQFRGYKTRYHLKTGK